MHDKLLRALSGKFHKTNHITAVSLVLEASIQLRHLANKQQEIEVERMEFKYISDKPLDAKQYQLELS